MASSDHLLVVVDPVARRADGESVRIARDVLSAGAAVRVCLPDGPEDFEKALARRGSRRLVVVGDDRALLRAAALLHRDRALAGTVLSLVPVGAAVTLARSLGVPAGAVAAARAALEGVARRLDLLADDRDGVVLGDLRIPPVPVPPTAAQAHAADPHPWLRTCQSLVRTLAARPARAAAAQTAVPSRLRVEADGVTLVDLDQPVERITVAPVTGTGLARVEIRPVSPAGDPVPVVARARTVTVSGADFRYRADAAIGGPVRTRTWTVHPEAWGLMLPG